METLKTFDFVYEGRESDSNIQVYQFSVEKNEEQISLCVQEYFSPGNKPDPETMWIYRPMLKLRVEILPEIISSFLDLQKEIDCTKATGPSPRSIKILDADTYQGEAVRPFFVTLQGGRNPGEPNSVIIKRRQQDSRGEWRSLRGDGMGRVRVPDYILPKFIEALQRAQEYINEEVKK